MNISDHNTYCSFSESNTESYNYPLLATAATAGCLLGYSVIKYIAKRAFAIHKTGRYTITQNIKHVMTGSIQCYKILYHSLLRKKQDDYHERKAQLSLEKLVKVFHNLSLLHDYIIYPRYSVKVLSTTRNLPKRFFTTDEGKRRLRVNLANLTNTLSVKKYVFSRHRLANLSDGVCNGMSIDFIIEFFSSIKQGYDIRSAAIRTANIFRGGATEDACLYQQFQYMCTRSSEPPGTVEEVVDKALSAITFKEFLTANIYLVGADYGNRIDTLPDGIYYVCTDLLESHHKTTPPTLSRTHYSNGHATALIVDNLCHYIFEPNIGLLRSSDPHDYFTSISVSETAVTIFARIVSGQKTLKPSDCLASRSLYHGMLDI